jgi:serine protease inhibitor
MLLNGASKVGQEELLKSLGFSAGELKDVNAAVSALMARMNAKGGSVETSMANALFADVGLPIKQDYAGLMESSFGATLKNVEFEKNPKAAAETVNKWAQDNTQGMVKEIVTEETAAELASLLATAVFFKGNWEQQFDPKSTYDDTFILANGDFAQVPTMHGTMDLKGIVDWEKGYNIAQLNYTGGDVSMYVMMPSGWDNKMTVEQLLAQVTSNGTLDKFSNGSQEVREFKGEVVNLPKFKIAYTNAELKDIFKAMGVNAVFDAGNLLGMSSDERLKVVYIRMDTALEVDEKGTKAAGVASIGSALESASSDPFDFNKPFAIVIRDNKTGINLFQGIIRDPRK